MPVHLAFQYAAIMVMFALDSPITGQQRGLYSSISVVLSGMESKFTPHTLSHKGLSSCHHPLLTVTDTH